MLALPARIKEALIPISSMISIPYLNEKTIPSWAALKRWASVCVLNPKPEICAPIFLFCNTRSDPFPNGRMLSPSDPMDTVAAFWFISSYESGSFPAYLFSQEFRIPVPLMHRSTPSRVAALVWLTWAKVLTLESGSYLISPLTPYTTPEVPAVVAISPGLRTFRERALLGWSPAR